MESYIAKWWPSNSCHIFGPSYRMPKWDGKLVVLKEDAYRRIAALETANRTLCLRAKALTVDKKELEELCRLKSERAEKAEDERDDYRREWQAVLKALKLLGRKTAAVQGRNRELRKERDRMRAIIKEVEEAAMAAGEAISDTDGWFENFKEEFYLNLSDKAAEALKGE